MITVQISKKETKELQRKSKEISKKKLTKVRHLENKLLEKQNDSQGNSKTRRFYFFVDGLTEPTTPERISSIFEPYGTSIRTLPTNDKYFTFVDLETTEEEAINAFIDLSGREFFGNVIKVQFRHHKGMDKIAAKARKVALERLSSTNAALDNLTGGPSSRKRGLDMMNESIEYPTQYLKQSKVELPDTVKALITESAGSSGQADSHKDERFKELRSMD